MKTQKFLHFLPFALCLIFFSFNLSSQKKVVTGNIADSKGPITGATISILDGLDGTISDIDGNYSLEVPSPTSVLVISYLGYTDQKIIVGDQSTINVIMVEDNKILQEVVVTALGIKKDKAKIGYATQEVAGTALQKATESNVAASLTGRVAGLSIYSKPNLFENAEVLLRGQATLVVIDGVPSQTDFWNISPNDIENINVLKGTAAAALYGALGINGAIMITTKKGKSGANGTEITFNSSNQFQAGFVKIPETQTTYGMGSGGKYSFLDGKGGGTEDGAGYVYGPKLNQADPTTKSGFVEIPQWNSEIDPTTGRPIPLPWITRNGGNLRSFLRNEFLTTDNLSVASKSDIGEYRLSLSHMYQKGQVPNTKLNSTTGTVSGSVNITSKLKAQSTVSYNRQYTPNYPSAGYGADNYFYNIILWMGPEVSLTDLQNYWQDGKKGTQQKTYNYTWYNNPWYLANEYLKGYTNDVVTGNTSLSYEVNKNFNIVARTGLTSSNVFTDRKTPYSFIYYGTGAAPQGNYSIERSDRLQVVSDVLATWNKNISDDFELTLSGGGSHRYNKSANQRSSTAGLNIPEFYNLSNSIAPVSTTNFLSEKEVKSAYGYADFNYKRMIYLGVTGRNDWTSALQKPFNSFFYPSASAGLIVSEMFKMPAAISYIKLRGAWANVSTDPEPYSTLPTYDTGTRWDGNLSLRLPGSLISPGLKPNQTISQEYGAEVKLLKSRLNFDLTYFTYDDKNFIVDAPISSASGFDSRKVNGGIINRKGVELTLNINPFRTQNFRWDINANYANAHTYRKEYYGNAPINDGVKVGERSDQYRGYTWQTSPDGKIVTSKGIPQYINQVVNLGFLDPDFVWGIGNSFNYKNFNFSFLFDGKVGGKMYNLVEAKLYEGGTHPGSANSYRDDSYAGKATYLVDGVNITEGIATYDIQGNITADTRKFSPNTTPVKYIDHLFATYVNGIDGAVLYDRTFFKLREIVLSYNLPKSLLKNKVFNDVSLSLIGRNLMLFTKVPFMDPDGISGRQGSQLSEPTYRNIGFNVNCKF